MGLFGKWKKIEEKTAEEWFELAEKAKDPEKRVKYYTKCLDLDLYDVNAWVSKGLALGILKRYEEALKCFDKALEIYPEYDDAWYSKGKVFYELERYEEALECYDRTLEKKPEDVYAWNSKGVTLMYLERYEEATECFDKALGIDPNHEHAKENRKIAEEKVAKEIKEKAKPEIEVELSKKTFQVGVWEEIPMNIFNSGNAHAKDIEIGFSEEVKVKGLEIIERLDAGEKRDLKVSFKPVDVGERVPLEISTRFKDLDGKRYGETDTVYINVGEITKEEIKEKGYEIPIEKEGTALIIERAIYDPCKGDFIEGRLPRMKEWINRYDKGAYWFAISIQNNTDKEINDWDVEIKTSSALKIEEAKIEGIEERIPQESHLGIFKLSVSKAHGYTIPERGQRRVYFKLRADKPKTTYEIKGIFKSAITGDVPIRAKEFKYLCDTGVSPEAVKAELKKTFSEKDAAMLALSFKTVQEIDRMCNQDTKTGEYQDKLLVLKNYTEGFSDKFSTHVNEFSRFMKEEQMGYLDDKYKGTVRRFCTNLVDVWINEFLKG